MLTFSTLSRDVHSRYHRVINSRFHAREPRRARLDPLCRPDRHPARKAGHRQPVAVAGSILLTLSAKISIPFYPVPLTMTTFVVIGLGLALGSRLGSAAVALYLLQGALGLPVFAGTPGKGHRACLHGRPDRRLSARLPCWRHLRRARWPSAAWTARRSQHSSRRLSPAPSSMCPACCGSARCWDGTSRSLPGA
jgi:hypothetical protein